MSSGGLARGAGRLFGWLGEARGRLYERGVFQQTKLPIPVVSVGNLSVGGTGKTPVVEALAEFFLKEGRKVAIVSRNYKARVRGCAEVRTDAGADFFGDEPFLLARRLERRVPVFVGPKKAETAVWAFRQNPQIDLILVDDGFQHRALHRDFDLVLLDATDPRAFAPVPAGRGRENPEALERADWILLTKTNWAEAESLARVRGHVPAGKGVTEARFQTAWPDAADFDAVGVFAGIARPEVFFDLARKKYFQKLRKTWAYADHQAYGESELAPLRAFLRENPRGLLVTTEKDAVKITDPELRGRCLPAGVTLEWQNAEKLFERLRTLVR
jgi:tetraacyldisaccharide 4'-kinase